MKIVVPENNETNMNECLRKFREARFPLALTGAGISVESGIPDFRSPGGLWTKFAPDEYATLDVFLRNPAKAWQLYKALGKTLEGKKPNAAHIALAQLEKAGLIHGVITQNVDMLHQQAGSKNVLEIHGDRQHLQCLECGKLEKVCVEHYQRPEPPVCSECGFILKPNVVLFGEAVRRLDEIHLLLQHCDLLLVIGTSAQVYPAAGLPDMVKRNNGLIYEFNTDETNLTRGQSCNNLQSDFFFQGRAAATLPLFSGRVGKKL